MILEPLVSVLMTSFNREKFIRDAIDSVLNSTYSNFELIIVDDNSSDRTIEIANYYASIDSRVKVYFNEINLGDYPNRNRAASYAKGKYIKYLDSDDIIMPWGLEIMVYCMEKYPSAALAFSPYHNDYNIYPILLSSTDVFREYYYRNRILSLGPTASIIRRDLFNQLGGFSGEQFIGDTELWFKLSQISSVICLPPCLTYWREHDQQQIVEEHKNSLIELKRFNLNMHVLRDDLTPLNKDERVLIIQNIRNIKTRNAIIYLLTGNFRKMFNSIRYFSLTLSDILCATKRNKVYSK